MTTPTRQPQNVVSIDGGADQKIDDGSITLDALTVPYGTADVILPYTPSAAALDDIDPRDDIRAVLTCSATGHWVTVPPVYSAWATQRTNQATNPSFEATSGTVEVRRNLMPDPRASSGSGFNARAGGTGAVAVLSTETVTAPPGTNLTSAQRTTITTPPSSGSTWLRVERTSVITVTASTVYTFSAWVRTNISGRGGQVIIIWRTSGGALISESPATLPATPGEWRRISVTATAPATAAQAQLQIGVDAGSTAGAYTEGTGWLFQASPILGSYFDGGFQSEPDADLTSHWIGTPNGSASTLTGPGVASTVAPGGALSSTQWFASGASSARVIPRGTSSDTYVAPGGDSGFQLGMQAGMTYTALATIRLAAAQTGTLHTRARRIVAFTSGAVTETPSTTAPNAAGVTQLSVTFTVPAGATGAWVRLYNGASAGNGDVWWDDFMLIEGTYTGDYFDGATPDPGPLERYEWTGTANASTSVYQTRTITTPPTVVWEPDAVRVFDLGIRERTIDHAAKTVHLLCTTDESMLMDHAALAQDTGALPLQASLRSIVNYVLGKAIPGASLQPGPDFDMTTYTPTTNILNNSGWRASVLGWVFSNNNGASTGAPIRAAMTAGDTTATEPNIAFKATASSLAANAAAGFYNNGGDSVASAPTFVTVTPGQTLNARLWMKSSAAATFRIGFQFANSTGVNAGAIYGASVAVPANTWTLVKGSVVVPANAARLGTFCYTQPPYPAASYNLETAGWVVTSDGRVPDEFFDGTTTDRTGYDYQWTGPTNASPSRRAATIDRLPEVLIWTPGVSAWEFLEPLTSSAGLRLFCDEERAWRMLDPATYLLPGFVRMSGDNSTEGTDLISRMNAEVFATGVVVRYSWLDSEGVPQTATDAAGTPAKVFVVEYKRAYPGPGAAAAILARRNGMGRAQAATALVDWDATPAMTASMFLPNTIEQQGKVSSVTFDLGDAATMQVGTAGLVEIPPGVIDALDGTIDGLVGTIDNLNPIARRP